jgi:hypothetical protein
MRLTRWNAWTAGPTAAGPVVAAAALTGTAAAIAAGTQAAAHGPVVKLIVAQNGTLVMDWIRMIASSPIGPPPIDATPAVTTPAFPAPKTHPRPRGSN